MDTTQMTLESGHANGRRVTTVNLRPANTARFIEHLRGKTYETFHVTLHSGEWEDGPFDSVTLFGNDGERAAVSFQIK